MDQNQPIILQPTDMPFELAEQSMCFLRGPLEWMMGAKNINDSYNFDLRSHVSEKQGNRSKENAGR